MGFNLGFKGLKALLNKPRIFSDFLGFGLKTQQLRLN